MKIELKQIPVRELIDGYVNNDEEGVLGYGGRLNIRPPYQREFIYKTEQKRAVIESVMNGFPLNVMYWSVNGDGTFEIIDGQQRTMSICEYCKSNMSFGFKIGGMERGFHNLTEDQKEKLLGYPLMVYLCEGTDSEKLAWFDVINTAGEQLTKQERRNAVYSGSWVTDAKRYFSRSSCVAKQLGGQYMSGRPERQEYLETAISWISGGKIEQYMQKHQHDPNANELWLYFKRVIDWVEVTFRTYRKEMRSVDWGPLYNEYGSVPQDSDALEKEIAALMMDEDVQKKSGIYPYVLTGMEKHLNLRAFPDSMKREAYERQEGRCARCGKRFDISEMEGDHIVPWSKGGRTVPENCQMLCADCNRRKSDA